MTVSTNNTVRAANNNIYHFSADASKLAYRLYGISQFVQNLSTYIFKIELLHTADSHDINSLQHPENKTEKLQDVVPNV